MPSQSESAPDEIDALLRALGEPPARERRLALLQSMAHGLRLKDHRDIEGHKSFVLHRVDDSGESVNWSDVEALVDAGLISREQRGKWAYYSIQSETLAGLADALRPR